MLTQLLALKRRRAQGLRRQIADLAARERLQAEKHDALRREQMTLYVAWDHQRNQRGHMTQVSLTVYLTKLQTLLQQYQETGNRLATLEKAMEDNRQYLVALNGRLRQVLHSQEKVTYLLNGE